MADLPDEDVMRYVVGQFDFLARLIEAGGKVCEKIGTIGGGHMCRVHGHNWTEARPCPVTYTISRGELVGKLRSLAGELDDYLLRSAPDDAPEAGQ